MDRKDSITDLADSILDYFENDEVDKQKTFIEHLDPENFKFMSDYVINPTIWQQFLKVLDEKTLEQEHPQKIFISATKYFFYKKKRYEFSNFFSLKPHHMKLMTLENYRPDIRDISVANPKI